MTTQRDPETQRILDRGDQVAREILTRNVFERCVLSDLDEFQIRLIRNAILDGYFTGRIDKCQERMEELDADITQRYERFTSGDDNG
jgi:hypothetical protein